MDNSQRKEIVLLHKNYTMQKIKHYMFIFFIFAALSFGLSYLPVIQKNEVISNILRDIGIGFLITLSITGLTNFLIVRHAEKFSDRISQFLKDDVSTSLIKIQEEITKQTESLKTDVGKSLIKMQSDMSEQTETLKNEVSKSTNDLIFSASSALRAMAKANLKELYFNREQAADDMHKSLCSPDITEIKIIGISMNDFFADTSKFNQVRLLIEKYIENDLKALCIKILICHPETKGAQLRARGESTTGTTEANRLLKDVTKTAEHFFNLEKRSKNNNNVKFEARLYQLSPVLFLFRTNHVSFVQQYFFWKPRLEGCQIPVLKFEHNLETDQKSMHDQMADHFDWLWQKASISICDYLDGKCIGIDKGLSQADTLNVFNDDVRKGSMDQGKLRLLWHLNNVKECLWLQGLSLHSYFTTGEFLNAIQNLVNKARIKEIKVLLLDPECEQAKYRAYREYCLKDENLPFEAYENDGLYKESRLYRETKDSIRKITELRNNSLKSGVNFVSKLYRTAPAFFMLRADNSILIEQYHYGKIKEQGDAVGKDMPLIEFLSYPAITIGEGKELFESDPGRKPFGLIENHFDFVFKHCSYDINSDKYLET